MLSRVAVLISGGGTNLQALIDAQQQGKNPYGEIVLVIANKPNVYGLTRAEKAGIPAFTVLKNVSQEVFEEELLSLLSAYRVDMVVLAGFLSILSENFVKHYPQRMINIHPSLLPAFAGKGMYGLRVHEAALQRGVKLTGATVHFVNEIADGGEILCQRAVKVHPTDTPDSLQRRVMEEAEWVILPEVVAALCQKITEEKKNENLSTKEISW